jgi:hypothetical protein
MAQGTLAGLLLEGILGLGLAFYVGLPSSPTVAQVFVSIPLLTAHIVLAFLLVAATAYFLLVARRSGGNGSTWRAAAVLLLVLVALQEGLSYSFTQNSVFSDGMALAFVLAVVVQASLLSVLRGPRARPADARSPGTSPP